MTKRPWTTIGLALAIVCALGWWAYKEVQRREVQRQVANLAQDSTARLREALGLLAAGAEARPRLKAHFAALEAVVSETQKLDRSIHPELIRAANAYLTDVHALLRRELALHAGRDAVRSDIRAIHGHLRASHTRSAEWISQALALQERLTSSFLDYRIAAGGLDKSFVSMRETSRDLRSFVPAAAVIEDKQLASAEKQLAELTTQMEPVVASAKKLSAG